MVRVLRLALALLVAVSATRAGEPDSLAKLLPERTPLFLSIQSPTPEEAKKTAAYGVLEDPKMKALLERIFGDANSLTTVTTPLGPAGFSVRSDLSSPTFYVDLRYVDSKGERRVRIENRIALAWIGMASDPVMPIDAVVALQVAGDASQARDLVERVVGAASLAIQGRTKGDIDAEMRKYLLRSRHEGVDITRISIDQTALYMAPVGSILVFTTTKDRLMDMVARAQGKSNDKSFADNPRYKNAVGRLPGTATTYFGLHVDYALDAVAKAEPQAVFGVRAFLQQFGLAGWTGISSTAHVDGEGVAGRTSMHFKGPRKGLARLFEGGEPAKLARPFASHHRRPGFAGG